MAKLKATVTEIEVGPHFLTIYGHSYREVCFELAEEVYKIFVRLRPELMDIQQQKFSHEAGDVSVYHPFGGPINFRKYFRHFHIRYGYKPNIEDITQIMEIVEELTRSKEYLISFLETNRMGGSENLQYPEPPEDRGEYLKYIEILRAGKWIERSK